MTHDAVPLSVARAKASDPVVLKGYFDMLEECLKENNIFDKPGCIFNCDETGKPLNPQWDQKILVMLLVEISLNLP